MTPNRAAKPTIRETVYNWLDNKQPGTTSIQDLDALVSALEYREMQDSTDRAAKEGLKVEEGCSPLALDEYLANIRKLASESEDPELSDYMEQIQCLLAKERAAQHLKREQEPAPLYPRPCSLCPGNIESETDLEWHGLGNCVEICERCGGSGQDPEKKPFTTPAENAELAAMSKRGVKWIQSAAQPPQELEGHILLLPRKEFDTLGDGYVRLSDVLAILREAGATQPPQELEGLREALKAPKFESPEVQEQFQASENICKHGRAWGMCPDCNDLEEL